MQGTLTEQGIGGASVSAGPLSATTAEDGRFSFSQATVPSLPLSAAITADGYLTRETRLGGLTRTDTLIDLIATTPPFSLTFYRQLVRDALESVELFPIYRWTSAPRIALHPFDDGGRPLPAHVLATIRESVPHAVAAWSGGRFTGVSLEETEVADWQEGWIVMHALRAESSEYCGTASFRYRGAGRIVTGRVELVLDNCGCGSQRISPNTISHEIAHAMGFWHVEGRHVLAPVSENPCSRLEREIITEPEALHARIAYTRPPGNRDPDVDPDSFTLQTDGRTGQSRTIVCRR